VELACRLTKSINLIGQDKILSGQSHKFASRLKPGAWKIESQRRIKGQVRKLNFTIIPDQIFCLHFPDDKPGRQHAYFFLEADSSTMPIKRTSLYTSSYWRKMIGYWESYRQEKFKEVFGFKAARVLTITKSEERIENMIRAGKGVDARGQGSVMFLFSPIENFTLVNPTKAFDKIWRNGRDNSMVDIIS
jgi:hypothetical protein